MSILEIIIYSMLGIALIGVIVYLILTRKHKKEDDDE